MVGGMGGVVDEMVGGSKLSFHLDGRMLVESAGMVE